MTIQVFKKVTYFVFVILHAKTDFIFVITT